MQPQLDIVVIGLNGKNLVGDCFAAIRRSAAAADVTPALFFVDSGSTDGTQDLIRAMPGVTLLDASQTPPRRSAARGRNTGARAGSAPAIMFVDCDTFLDPAWLGHALAALAADPRLGCAWGRLHERYPDKNIYHWIADLEWNMHTGHPVPGGNLMVRREAFEKTGGYNSELSVGEESDFAERILKSGLTQTMLSVNMGTHDIAMDSFRLYWKRCTRSGKGFAEAAASKERTVWRAEIRRILVRGLLGPAGMAGGAGLMLAGWLTNVPFIAFVGLLAAVCGCILLMWPLIFSRKRFGRELNLSRKDSARYAMHCSFVVIPEVCGMLETWFSHLKKRGAALIALAFLGSLAGCTWPEPLDNVNHIYDPRNDLEVMNAVNSDHPFDHKNLRVKSDYNPEAQQSEAWRAKLKTFEVYRRENDPLFATTNEIAELDSKFENDGYKIGPGDVLSIQIWHRPEASVERAVVSPDGLLAIPRVGYLDVRNWRVPDVRDYILNNLKAFYDEPEVLVDVREYNNNKAFVLGRVDRPGLVKFSGEGTVMEAIALAGGLPPIMKEAFLTRCSIIRGKEQVIWIDLKSLLEDGNTALNAKIQNNDIIYIPEGRNEVAYIMGEVSRPSIAQLRGRVTLLDAILGDRVGGPLRTANLEKVYVVRNSDDSRQSIVICANLQKFIEHGDVSDNFVLKHGDVVYVSPTRIAKWNYFMDNISPSIRMINLTTDTAEDFGVMAELRSMWWGQEGFVSQ